MYDNIFQENRKSWKIWRWLSWHLFFSLRNFETTPRDLDDYFRQEGSVFMWFDENQKNIFEHIIDTTKSIDTRVGFELVVPELDLPRYTNSSKGSSDPVITEFLVIFFNFRNLLACFYVLRSKNFQIIVLTKNKYEKKNIQWKENLVRIFLKKTSRYLKRAFDEVVAGTESQRKPACSGLFAQKILKHFFEINLTKIIPCFSWAISFSRGSILREISSSLSVLISIPFRWWISLCWELILVEILSRMWVLSFISSENCSKVSAWLLIFVDRWVKTSCWYFRLKSWHSDKSFWLARTSDW